MRKTCNAFFLIILTLGILVGSLTTKTTKAATTINSTIITQDTTWTKANSPYTLTGPIQVSQKATLTIEPGVTIKPAQITETITIDGTLISKGTSSNQIKIINTKIIFNPSSTSYNELTKSGCIIENTQEVYVEINNASPKISHNNKEPIFISIAGGSPIIDQNYIGDIRPNKYGSNTAGSPVISNNIIRTDMQIKADSPTIYNNILNGTITYEGHSGTVVIANNIITPRQFYVGLDAGIHSIPYSWQPQPGIILGKPIDYDWILSDEDFSIYVSDNTISGASTAIQGGIRGKVTIERNLLFNNTKAIEIQSEVIIRENTIYNNSIAIEGNFVSATINENNIYGNNLQNILTETAVDVDATNNWWGTTSAGAIKQKISYVENDYNYGEVFYTPFLTKLNLNAYPSSEPYSPPKHQQTEFPTIPVIVIGLIGILVVGTVVIFKKKK